MIMSMTFNAIKPVNHPKYGQIFECVFPNDWLVERFYEDMYDCTNENFVVNPAYRPDLDINLSNDNAEMIINMLGYKVEDGYFSANINEFIARATQYLQKKLGKPSAEIETIISGGDTSALLIDCGTPAGYVEEKVHRIVVMARVGRDLGAAEISAA